MIKTIDLGRYMARITNDGAKKMPSIEIVLPETVNGISYVPEQSLMIDGLRVLALRDALVEMFPLEEKS